ncbi:MAG: YwaF family protein [Bacilli bacterium]|nr:YwaF family protein [Bacilli bacterium]
MNFLEIVKKFLGLIDTGESNYLDSTHIIIASVVTVITAFLGIYLGIRNKNKTEKDKAKLIFPFSIAMWILLILRFVMIVVRGYNFGENGFMNLVEGNLPLFLCDIQYFALIAICFGKGEAKKVGLDFCLCLGLLSFAMGVWLNAGTYGGNPWWSSCYFYEMAVHAIPGGISLYLLASNMTSLKFKGIWKTLAVLAVFEIVALIFDYTLDSNYMFFKRDSGTPFFIFTDLANGNQILYSFFVWLGMTLYVALYYGVWELVVFILKKTKRQSEN